MSNVPWLCVWLGHVTHYFTFNVAKKDLCMVSKFCIQKAQPFCQRWFDNLSQVRGGGMWRYALNTSMSTCYFLAQLVGWLIKRLRCWIPVNLLPLWGFVWQIREHLGPILESAWWPLALLPALTYFLVMQTHLHLKEQKSRCSHWVVLV